VVDWLCTKRFVSLMKSRKVLTIAPQVAFPVRSGGARRVFGILKSYEELGLRSVAALRNGRWQRNNFVPSEKRRVSERVARSLGGIEALLRKRSYNEVRFASRKWFNVHRNLILKQSGDLVVVHFLASLPGFLQNKILYRNLVIETHNNDWEWWGNFKKGRGLSSMVAQVGYDRVAEILGMAPDEAIFVHLSEADLAAYQEFLPKHRHYLLPNGCDRPHRVGNGSGENVLRLLFLGSLSSKINQDAIRYFFEKFWPNLKGKVKLMVAGSSPPPWLGRLVAEEGAEMRADLEENEVESVFASADFLILPFEYGAGSKLKVMDSLSRGVPLLSTGAGLCGLSRDELSGCTFVSDDADAWKKFLHEVGPVQRSNMSDAALLWVKGHTWTAHVGRFFEYLDEEG